MKIERRWNSLWAGWLLTSGLIATWAAVATAQENPATKTQPKPAEVGTADAKPGRGLVFHVKGKDGGEVFLAGSVHLLRKADHPLPQPYADAYAKAKALVFELPPSSMATPQAMVTMQKHIMYLDGTTIKDHMSAEGFAELTKYAKRTGINIAQLQIMKPWMIAQMIVMQEFSGRGFQPALGIDAFLESKALADKKDISGLETLEFQLGLFSGLAPAQQEKMLTATLSDLSDVNKMIEDMIGAWRNGDPAKMAKVMNEAMDEDPALGKALLYDRNRNWVAPIEGFLKSDKPTMVIVGAGHLCGKDSVVELLQKNGHTVTQQ